MKSQMSIGVVNRMKSQVTDEINKLYQLRKKMRWPQQKLAFELGVSISTIARWESGKNTPGNLAAEKIIRFLKKHKEI